MLRREDNSIISQLEKELKESINEFNRLSCQILILEQRLEEA